MLLVWGWRAWPLPCRGSGVAVPPLPPCHHGHPGKAGKGCGEQHRGSGWQHPWVGGTQRPSVQPPPNSQGCLMPNVFQPRPQANFNFLVIMQMNVDLIKGRFH